MFKLAWGLALLFTVLAACNNDENEKAENEASQGMTALFKEVNRPYQLTDTGLLKNTDTSSLPSADVAPFIADSVKDKYFGKNAAIRYMALAKISQKEKETYYIVKASVRNKAAALLLVADKENNFVASYPFLLPDADANTTQVSIFDKNFTITKTVILRRGADVIGEGKEVLSYDPSTKSFGLIMEDALADNPAVLVNPIDTFPRTNKLSGDYLLNKKNMVAVRDGRYANQLLVFIYTENETGDCRGQMKGEFVMTSPTTATFRQGGDPCVLGLTFKGNTVSIHEESGCGNYRGLDCQLQGTFTRKKQQGVKQIKAKTKGK